jgi:preprotein translocase subunit YajC
MSFLISDALAAAPAGAAQPANEWSSIALLVGFVIIFYFLLLRPQSKRAKEHRQLVSNLAKGDEVITSGGILGKITKITDDFIVVSIAEGVEITLQKQAIGTVLPKGTIKSL